LNVPAPVTLSQIEAVLRARDVTGHRIDRLLFAAEARRSARVQQQVRSRARCTSATSTHAARTLLAG
jgi:hypothetical protein